MQPSNRPDEGTWGLRLNRGNWTSAQDWPMWANRGHQEKWKERGLLIWDNVIQEVTRLDGRQAIALLNYHRHNSEWRESGLVVGEPASRISLDEPERQSELVLTDKITLSPAQAQILFDFLVQEEETLLEMKAAEEDEEIHTLAKVYRLLLAAAARKNKVALRHPLRKIKAFHPLASANSI